ncbi:hypothetical protein [Pseudolactococcus raffinolactis]|uniref:hypothetical protein n=1 Tax=Pseudolactococcus raffinolactis TaxID=1366 RepID=UPI000BB4ED2D|nr:hypothetical protein [Lactococcus raffinolactis]ATC60435.1 hypothetical protein CMV25_00405 [Lactococcus raffinolactis]
MKPYFSITNTIFNNKDMNEWDYATLVAIACNNLPFVSDADSKTTEIETSYVAVETLIDTLKIENDNRKRNRDKINESLKKLAKASVVKVVDVKEIAKRKYFKFSQEVSKTGANQGFSSITAEEFEKIAFGIEKVTDKVKALACYVSIAHRIFRATKTEKDANFNWSSNLSNFICWDTLETIGNNYNMSRKAVSKSIELLVEVEAIAIKKVKLRGKSNKEEKLIFSKYSDAEKLDSYVSEQIEKGEYTKVVKAKAVAKETVQEINPVVEEVVEEQLQALISNNADEVVEERTEPIRAVKVEKKEDKQKVININDDERMKKLEALASFENVKNVDEREEESKADAFDLLAEYRTDKKTATV